MQPGRLSDKHAFEHPLRDPKTPRVADEVRAEHARAGGAKRHIVAEDVVLDAVVVFDRRERLVRLLPAGGRVVELHVLQLRAPDDGLLLLGGQGAPGLEVVHVLLHDDVAAAGGGGVFLGDEDRGRHGGTDGVGGAVDEAEEVAHVEVAEADCLVDDGGGVAEEVHQLSLELEAEISPLRAYVEEDVARRRGGVVGCALDGGEWMELHWPG